MLSWASRPTLGPATDHPFAAQGLHQRLCRVLPEQQKLGQRCIQGGDELNLALFSFYPENLANS
jgi:hypothetical protein